PGNRPSLTITSLWQIPHASTFTSTCPRPGCGTSRSTISKSPPALLICAAFIFVVIFCCSVSSCSQLTPLLAGGDFLVVHVFPILFLLGGLLTCQPGDEPGSKKSEH